MGQEERAEAKKEFLFFSSPSVKKHKKWMSALMALIFLFGALYSPAYAQDINYRSGNYGKNDAWSSFGLGALAGALTALSCVLSPVAGVIGSFASEAVGNALYFGAYSFSQKRLFSIGSIDISVGTAISMAAGIVAGAAAGFAQGASAAGKAAAQGAGAVAKSSSKAVSTWVRAVIKAFSAVQRALNAVSKAVINFFVNTLGLGKILGTILGIIIGAPIHIAVGAVKAAVWAVGEIVTTICKVADFIWRLFTNPASLSDGGVINFSLNSPYVSYGAAGNWGGAGLQLLQDLGTAAVELYVKTAVTSFCKDTLGMSETASSIVAGAVGMYLRSFVSVTLSSLGSSGGDKVKYQYLDENGNVMTVDGKVVRNEETGELGIELSEPDGKGGTRTRVVSKSDIVKGLSKEGYITPKELGVTLHNLNALTGAGAGLSNTGARIGNGTDPSNPVDPETGIEYTDKGLLNEVNNLAAREVAAPTHELKSTTGASSSPDAANAAPGSPAAQAAPSAPLSTTQDKLANAGMSGVDIDGNPINTRLAQLGRIESIQLESLPQKNTTGTTQEGYHIISTLPNGQRSEIFATKVEGDIALDQLSTSTLNNIQHYATLCDSFTFRLTGGLMVDTRGQSIVRHGAVGAGWEAMRNMGLSPLISAVGKAVMLDVALPWMGKTLGIRKGKASDKEGYERALAEQKAGNDAPMKEWLAKWDLNWRYSTDQDPGNADLLVKNTFLMAMADAGGNLAGNVVNSLDGLMSNFAKTTKYKDKAEGTKVKFKDDSDFDATGRIVTREGTIKRDEQGEIGIEYVDDYGQTLFMSKSDLTEAVKESRVPGFMEEPRFAQVAGPAIARWARESNLRTLHLPAVYHNPWDPKGSANWGQWFGKEVLSQAFTVAAKTGLTYLVEKQWGLTNRPVKRALAYAGGAAVAGSALNLIPWRGDVATNGWGILNGINPLAWGETTNNIFLQAAFDTVLYDVRSPGTGLNAFQTNWATQNKYAQRIEGMMNGVSHREMKVSAFQEGVVNYSTQFLANAATHTLANLWMPKEMRMYGEYNSTGSFVYGQLRKDKELEIKEIDDGLEALDKTKKDIDKLKEKFSVRSEFVPAIYNDGADIDERGSYLQNREQLGELYSSAVKNEIEKLVQNNPRAASILLREAIKQNGGQPVTLDNSQAAAAAILPLLHNDSPLRARSAELQGQISLLRGSEAGSSIMAAIPFLGAAYKLGTAYNTNLYEVNQTRGNSVIIPFALRGGTMDYTKQVNYSSNSVTAKDPNDSAKTRKITEITPDNRNLLGILTGPLAQQSGISQKELQDKINIGQLKGESITKNYYSIGTPVGSVTKGNSLLIFAKLETGASKSRKAVATFVAPLDSKEVEAGLGEIYAATMAFTGGQAKPVAEGLGIAIPQGIEDVTDVTDTRLQAFNQAIYRAQVAQVLINESQPSVDNQALITKLNTCSIQDIAATAAPGLFEARKADVTERRRQMTDDGIKESVARLITWVPDDGDAQSRNVVQNRLADLDAVAGNLYHPQSMVLDRTLVDNYGRSISTAYYGMDYVPAWPVAIGPPAPGRFTPVKLDKVTNYYWGSYGQAVSLTTDYSDIRVPDVWPTKTITRLVPGENVLDTGLLIREQRYAFHGPSDADHALDNRLSTWGDAIAKYAEEGKYEPKSIEELKVLVRQLRERVPDIDEKVNHFWRTHGRPNYRGGLGDNTNWAHILAVLAQPGVAEQLYSGVKTRHDNMWDYLFWATSQTEPFLTSSHVEQPWISQNNVNRLLMPAGSGQAISVDPTWHPGKGTDVTAVAPILFPIVNTSREETKTTPQSITLGPNITATLNVYETGPGASPYTGPSRIINAYRYNSGSALQPFYAAPRHIVSAKANDLERQYVDSRLQTEHSDKLAEYQGKKTDAEREKYWNDQIVPLIDGKDGNPGLLAQFRADTFVMPANIPTDKQDAWNSIKSQWEALRPQREITNNADGTRTVTYEKADKHAYDYASSPLKSAEGVSVSEMHRIDRRDVPIALWSLGTGMDIEGQRISPHLQNYTHNPQEVAKIITTEYNTALTDGYRDKLKMVKGFLFNRGGDEIQTVIEDQDNSPNYEVLYSESRQIPGPQEFRVLFPDGLFEGADRFDVGADPIPGLERPRRVNRFLFWREGFTDIGKLHSYISEPKPAPKESLSVPPVPEMPESPVPAEGELAPNLKFKGNDNQLYILVPHKKGFYTVDGKRVDSVKGLGLKRVLSTDEKNKIDIEKQVPARLKITPEMIHSAAETTQHK